MSLIGSNLPRQGLGNFDALTGSLVLYEHFRDPGSTHREVSMDGKTARPGHTVFTAMPSRTAQYPRAPRPLTPDKFGPAQTVPVLQVSD
jgi:hypothetical protein